MDGNEPLVPVQCPFEQDPDIGGIGVRISFYIQCFVLVLLIALSSKESSSALWTLIATSLGLQIASLVQYHNKLLTLFQAVQVSNLVWMANICIVIGLASYSRRRKTKLSQWDFLVQVSAFVEILLSVTLSLVLWIKSPDLFTSDGGCTRRTPFLLLKWDIGATTNAGRALNGTLVGIFFVVYAYITSNEMRSRYVTRKADMEAAVAASTAEIAEEGVGLGLASGSGRPRKGASDDSTTSHGHGHGHGALQISEPRILMRRSSAVGRPGEGGLGKSNRRKRQDRSDRFSGMIPYLAGLLLMELIVLPYFVATNELLIKRSRLDATSSQWGFGQILALIVVFPAVLTLLRILLNLVRRQEDEVDEKGNPKNVFSVLSRL